MQAVIYAFRSPGSGAVYIGKHQCDPGGWPRRGNGRLPDGYRGSGDVVPRFHERHGDRVEWRILAVVSLDDWPRAERRAIHLARLLLGRRCVNIRDGGDGWTREEARMQAHLLAADPAQLARLRQQASLAGRSVSEASRRSAAEKWRANPETVHRLAAMNREKPNIPGFREKLAQSVAEVWEDPVFRDRHGAAMAEARARTRADPKAYARLCDNASAAARRREADPDHKARKAEMYASVEWRAAVKDAAQRPEVKAKVSAAARRSWSDPQRKAAHAQTQRQLWADPDHAAKMKAARRRRAQSPEGKAQLAALHALNARRRRARKALAPFLHPPLSDTPGLTVWLAPPGSPLGITTP